ncbi:MAG: class I SAM-dependent methyltransferase [Anaerolineae bacterium]
MARIWRATASPTRGFGHFETFLNEPCDFFGDSNPPPAFHAASCAQPKRSAFSVLVRAADRGAAARPRRIKPGGSLLEIGTGAGVGTCWLLDGMDASATLITVELDAQMSTIARQYLGSDSRATFITGDAEDFLKASLPPSSI